MCLSRKKNEVIVLKTPEGRWIEVHTVDIRGDKVRLGIRADRDVRIDRKEVWDARLAQAAKANRESISVPVGTNQQEDTHGA